MADTQTLTGLSSAEVQQRIDAGQVNKTTKGTGRSTWDIIRANVFTRINALLFVLFVLAFMTIDDYSDPKSYSNVLFGLLIIANSAIGIIQELRAKHTLESLKIVGESKPIVLRDGKEVSISQDQVVQGDSIKLSSGDDIVVDGKVIEGSFSVDESNLTGESDPVAKHVDEKIMSGSFVTNGSGWMLAEKVGDDAYAAQLSHQASEFSLVDSQLMDGINQILKVITWLLIPTGLLTVFTQLFRTNQDLSESVLSMVASLVPMIPEGLVLMTSIAFAAGVIRLGNYKVLVNELPAIEGLARADTVCSDKTGTLTSNEMDLQGVYSTDAQGNTSPAGTEDKENLFNFISAQQDRNITSDTLYKDLGEELHKGDNPQSAWSGEEYPFNSINKYSGFDAGTSGKWVMGAPDVLIDSNSPLQSQIEKFSAQGIRVLVFGQTIDSFDHVENLENIQLIVVEQSLRPDAAETIEFFTHEGVEVKVISGDNAESVGEIARKAKLSEHPKVIDARTLPGYATEPEKFTEIIEDTEVFGRVSPEQKQDIVHALQSHGHEVAMTGDGVNDILAMKDSNIGVAMGSGASATRVVAQLVLLNNDFSALPHAVAEGRRVIGNIERVANLFLTKTVYSIVLALVIGIWGVAYPFQPIHVTMIGWFTIGIPAFILSLAPNYERPRDHFVRRVLQLAVPSGIVIGVLVSAFWLVNYDSVFSDNRLLQLSTATLAALLVMGVWVLGIIARPYNWWRLALVIVSALAYVVLFTVPVFQDYLMLDPSDQTWMIQGLLVGAVGAALVELFYQLVARGIIKFKIPESFSTKK